MLPETNKLLVISVAKWVYLGSRKFWNLGMDFPRGSVSKESACGAEDLGLSPGLGRFPWRRTWQSTLAFLPGESPRTEEPGGFQSMGLQRV